MPIYEYRCARCGHCFEQIRAVSGKKEEKTACPQCGSPDADRILSAFSCGGGNRGGGPAGPSGGCGPGGGRFS